MTQPPEKAPDTRAPAPRLNVGHTAAMALMGIMYELRAHELESDIKKTKKKVKKLQKSIEQLDERLSE